MSLYPLAIRARLGWGLASSAAIKAEIVRKALGVYRYLIEEEKKGAKVEISKPGEDEVRRLVINPGL